MVNIKAMKTIFPKFKINSITYLIFLSFLLTGFIKNILIIFIIILFHELGHIFFLKCFKYEIEKVEIFPFGGVTTTNKYINSPINKDIIIYLGGAFFQMILYFLFWTFSTYGIINENTYSLFKMYNQSILLFNLLPIKPLDGGEIVLLIIQKHVPYSKSLSISNAISILFLILFLLYNIHSNLNNYVIISFLLYKTIYFFQKKKFYQNKFLLERYMHNLPFRKIEHNIKQSTELLKKETLHFFKEKNKYMHEREILKRKFDIHTYF